MNQGKVEFNKRTYFEIFIKLGSDPVQFMHVLFIKLKE